MDKDAYDVDPKFKSEFNPDKFADYLRAFKGLDIDKSGSVTTNEIIKGIYI